MPKYFDPNYSKKMTQAVTIYGNRLTLTGTSGTANVTVGTGTAAIVNTLIATFATDLCTTATNWVAGNFAYYYARGIVVKQEGNVIVFDPRYDWDTVNRINVSIANVTGNLSGTLVGTFVPDLTKAKLFQVTFGQNIIIKRPKGLVEGDHVRFELKATGAYSTTWASQAQVITATLSGSSGTATVTVGGVAKLATFAAAGTQDLTQTAADFVTSWAGAYALAGIVLTSSTTTLIFTAATAGVPILGAASVVNATGNLAGTVVGTTANLTSTAAYVWPSGTANVQTSTALDIVEGVVNISMFPREDLVTLTGLSSGTCTITAGGVTKTATFNSTLSTTGSDFVTANAAAYALVGLTLTSSSGVLSFKVAGLPNDKANYLSLPVVTPVTGTLGGVVTSKPAGRVSINAADKALS